MSQPLYIIAVIAAYFAVLLVISHFASRGSDGSAFFGGRRKIPWPFVTVAMICAPISGVTFISVPGMVAAKGYTYLQMCLGFVVGYLAIAFVLLPVFYRNNVCSIYSYLGQRFGRTTNRTGAWLFFISKILGTAVRLFVICAMLQLLVFGPLDIPFPLTVVAALSLIWLYTMKGGVKAVVWTDMFKCLCIIVSAGMCIYFLCDALSIENGGITELISAHSSSRIFNFSEPREETYFWKQFIAGIFLVVAMTGLDQDMMQHALTCRNASSSMKNMIISSIMQFVVIGFFLLMGTLLLVYAETMNVALPEKSDNIFGTVAFHEGLPFGMGIFFVIGLVAATYSSVGSALTSLTTSYTIDICGFDATTDTSVMARQRKTTHAVIALVMAIVIIAFYYLSHQDAISAVFTLASYTYGPILGLFVFGLFTNRHVKESFIRAICLLAPVLCLAIKWMAKDFLDYEIGFELLILNASITVLCLFTASALTASALGHDPENSMPR